MPRTLIVVFVPVGQETNRLLKGFNLCGTTCPCNKFTLQKYVKENGRGSQHRSVEINLSCSSSLVEANHPKSIIKIHWH